MAKLPAPPRPGERPTVLVVDDMPENLRVLAEILASDYQVLVATSGPRALELARGARRPELMLLDVMMPGMDGYEVIRKLHSEPATADMPVIFVTAMGSTGDEQVGFDLGAVDYLTKPVCPPIVRARVRSQLELKAARDWLRNQNEFLEREVQQRLADNQAIQDVSIHALARLAETRDPETGHHILRTQAYVKRLALRLQQQPRFAELLTTAYIEHLAKSAPLHDIGKVGIPDHILRKPGPLSPEEWAVMKTHAALGAAAIESAEHDVTRPIEFLKIAKQIAHWHHERWDGSGYPDGLRGDAIPLPARLMALADVFDALVSRRVYKNGWGFDQARDAIVAESGSHFDPDVVQAFLAELPDFQAIAQRYRDEA